MRRVIGSLHAGACNFSRKTITSVLVLLIAANLASWLWTLALFHAYPALLGTALLAYFLGLRHAFDADHIAAIDNMTRKLVQQGKRPIAAGLFFALGHSTVVVGLSLAIALATVPLQDHFELFRSAGRLVGTFASSSFLLVVAVTNILVLMSIYQTILNMRKKARFDDGDLLHSPSSGGILTTIFGSLFRLFDRSWQMYPLGILFGLGFDTATEVGLLAISATQAAEGRSLSSILVFPALFTAGMTLMDTADSILMVRAYSWALIDPIRKLYYNLTITAMSVIVAIVVAVLEILDLVGGRLDLSQGTGIWGQISSVNSRFGELGLLIVATFGLAWLIAYAIQQARPLEK
ncbi:high-affinity nickel-transport protein [Bradyrhizobium niftali]